MHFDSLRGVACFIVVLSHIALSYFTYLHNLSLEIIPEGNEVQSFLYNSPLGFFYSGTFSVFVFFILSGIVIYLSASRKDVVEIMPYFISRYVRLAVPVIATNFLCYFVFEIIDSYELRNYSSWLASLIVSEPNLFDAIVGNMFRAFFIDKSSYNIVL